MWPRIRCGTDASGLRSVMSRRDFAASSLRAGAVPRSAGSRARRRGDDPPASTDDDVAAIRAVYSEPDIRHWMGWDGEPPPDAAEARANIARAANSWREGSWAVFRIADRATDRVVGGVNLRFAGDETAEVSYFLHPSARGRGWATRAVLLVSRWAFDDL